MECLIVTFINFIRSIEDMDGVSGYKFMPASESIMATRILFAIASH